MSEGVAQKSRPVCVLFPTQLRAGCPQASWQPRAPSSPSSRVHALESSHRGGNLLPFPERCWSSSQRRRTRCCGTGQLPRGRRANTRAQTVHGAGSTADGVTLLSLQEAKRNPFARWPQLGGLSAHSGPRERPLSRRQLCAPAPFPDPPTLNTSFVNQRSTLHTMGTWRS